MFSKDRKIYLASKTKSPALIVFCIILGVIPIFSDNFYLIRLCSLIMCNALLAISIDLLTGYAGLSAYGNAAFFGIAAYVAAWCTKNTELPFLVVCLIAITATAFVAWLFGIICNNIWGTTFLIVNLTLGQCIWGLAFRMASITGGEMGMPGIVRPKSLFGLPFDSGENYYYFIFIVFVIVVFFVYMLVNSPFGLTIHGIRQSRKRMSAMGYDVLKHKHITYVISGTIAGIGGLLYVFLVSFVSPNLTNTLMMSKAFLMALAGGIGTISGGIVGATIIVITENLVSSITERWCSILGLLYIFVAVICPRGVIGLIRNSSEWLKQKKISKSRLLDQEKKSDSREKEDTK